MTSTGTLPMFTVEGYNTWSYRVESHLASIHDRMWQVVTTGPIKITKVVTGNRVTENRDAAGTLLNTVEGTPDRYVEKPIEEYSAADFKLDNLDRVARNVISLTVSDAYLPRIMKCKTAKEMWDTLALLSQGTEKIKENKLSVLLREFEALTMKKNETMESFETRVLNMVSSLTTLGKDLSHKEINSKVVDALSDKWLSTQENYLFNKNLGDLSPEALFSDFKAIEFHLNRRAKKEEEQGSRLSSEKGLAFKAKEAFTASEEKSSDPAAFSDGDIREMPNEELQDFALALLRGFNSSNARAAKYKRFFKRQQGHLGQTSRFQKDGRRETAARSSPSALLTMKCHACHKMGHYKSICPSISEKVREELKAKQTKARRALVAEEAGPSDSVNHCNDQFTDDESEGNDFSYDMGLLAFDMEEEEEFNLMAMSESDSEIEEVSRSRFPNPTLLLDIGLRGNTLA